MEGQGFLKCDEKEGKSRRRPLLCRRVKSNLNNVGICCSGIFLKDCGGMADFFTRDVSNSSRTRQALTH